MKVVPLAAESLGVRSMATYVEVGGTGILIDPGATLAPARFGLPPAEDEWEALRRANDRISAYATRSSFVFVSHYHEDHFRSDPATYAGRLVLAKDPRRMIAGRQAQRAVAFWKALEGAARVESADGVQRRESGLELRVSPPLPHGVDGTPFGSVLALTIVDPAERERFVFAGDVQGPASAVAAAYLIQQRPTLVYLSGPVSYLEREVGRDAIERAIDQLVRIVEATGCRVIMDHHAVRDARYAERFARLWETRRVVTAAAFLGLPEAPLESRRNRAWSAARRPPARTGEPRAKIDGRSARRFAQGGFRE
jgi:predicted metallo-beta-lactamase superfamily hydrolase